MPASTSKKVLLLEVAQRRMEDDVQECKAQDSTLLNCPIPSAVLRLTAGIVTPQEADDFPSHGLILLHLPVM